MTAHNLAILRRWPDSTPIRHDCIQLVLLKTVTRPTPIHPNLPCPQTHPDPPPETTHIDTHTYSDRLTTLHRSPDSNRIEGVGHESAANTSDGARNEVFQGCRRALPEGGRGAHRRFRFSSTRAGRWFLPMSHLGLGKQGGGAAPWDTAAGRRARTLRHDRGCVFTFSPSCFQTPPSPEPPPCLTLIRHHNLVFGRGHKTCLSLVSKNACVIYNRGGGGGYPL